MIFLRNVDLPHLRNQDKNCIYIQGVYLFMDSCIVMFLATDFQWFRASSSQMVTDANTGVDIKCCSWSRGRLLENLKSANWIFYHTIRIAEAIFGWAKIAMATLALMSGRLTQIPILLIMIIRIYNTGAVKWVNNKTPDKRKRWTEGKNTNSIYQF